MRKSLVGLAGCVKCAGAWKPNGPSDDLLDYRVQHKPITCRWKLFPMLQSLFFWSTDRRQFQIEDSRLRISADRGEKRNFLGISPRIDGEFQYTVYLLWTLGAVFLSSCVQHFSDTFYFYVETSRTREKATMQDTGYRLAQRVVTYGPRRSPCRHHRIRG